MAFEKNLTENNANQSIHKEEQAKADIYSTPNVNSWYVDKSDLAKCLPPPASAMKFSKRLY